MSDKPRFVFDTNVIVTAAIRAASVPRQALDAARAQGQLLVSRPLILEIDEVLRRPKFDRYVSEHDRLLFLAAIMDEFELVETTQTIEISRDADDNRLLELAVAGQASCLVTGDQDLIVLNPFQGIPILTPRQFLDSIVPKPEPQESD
jgi:putative PIN family toxin of toxin-antitoxin system